MEKINNKIIIISIIGLIIIAASGLVLRSIFLKPEKKLQQLPEISKPSPSPTRLNITFPIKPTYPRRESIASPQISPLPPLIHSPTPSATTAAILQLPTDISSLDIYQIQLSPSFQKKIDELRKEGRKYFTQEELFELQWPLEYRQKLSYLQDLIVQQGLLPESDRVQFKNQEEIIGFLIKFLPIASQMGIISQEDAERYRRTITTDLINAKVKEREILEKKLLQGYSSENKIFAPNKSYSSSNPDNLEPLTLGRAIVEIFKMLFYPQNVKGQEDCFQVITFNPGIYGPVFWAPCCRGGFCCLDYFCAGRSAIWDRVTGICGCDI